MNNFKKVTIDEQKEIYGAGVLAVIGVVVPLLIQGALAITSIVKAATSHKTEIKTNDISIKTDSTRNLPSASSSVVSPQVVYVNNYLSY